jgi:hypothetical protein
MSTQYLGGSNTSHGWGNSTFGFKWHEDQWAYKDENEAPAVLSVRDSDGNVVQLE